jgi:hypothetical protein
VLLLEDTGATDVTVARFEDAPVEIVDVAEDAAEVGAKVGAEAAREGEP